VRKILKCLLWGTILSSGSACSGQKDTVSNVVAERKEVHQTKPKDLAGKASAIKQSYLKVSRPHSANDEKEYFEQFPGSFDEFNSLFGYAEQDQSISSEFKAGPLYEESNIYIEAFFNLKEIGKITFYDKIIDISLGGKWFGDGVNYFSHGLEEKMTSDVSGFIETLAKRDSVQMSSFWYFYFDNVEPPEKIPVELIIIKEKNPAMFKLMENELEKVKVARKE